MASIDHPSFTAEHSNVSEFSSVRKASQFCDFLRTMLYKDAPNSLQKISNYNSSPWFELIREICKNGNALSRGKIKEHKAIFRDLYRQATDTVLQWFSSYLTDQTQCVCLYNHCSAFAPVHWCSSRFSSWPCVFLHVH